MKVALPCALWEICILSTLEYLGTQNCSVMCFSVQKLGVFVQAAVFVCEGEVECLSQRINLPCMCVHVQ